jgi:hypothetical protein
MERPPQKRRSDDVADIGPRAKPSRRLHAHCPTRNGSLWRLLGSEPDYVICVNTIPLPLPQERTGRLSNAITWRDVTAEFPTFPQPYFDAHKAEGVGWKFAPLRLSPACLERALDNDCILWELPSAVLSWLQTPGSFLFAEDVRACLGQFANICGLALRNSGIRGLLPGFDLGHAMIDVLGEHRFTLRSELDE